HWRVGVCDVRRDGRDVRDAGALWNCDAPVTQWVGAVPLHGTCRSRPGVDCRHLLAQRRVPIPHLVHRRHRVRRSNGVRRTAAQVPGVRDEHGADVWGHHRRRVGALSGLHQSLPVSAAIPWEPARRLVAFELATPKRLPKGTKVEVVAHYDNSPGNKYNPDPTKDVKWGDQTWEEMMIGFWGSVVDASGRLSKKSSDRASLKSHRGPAFEAQR